MLDPVVVVACCAGLGLTLSYFTLGSHRLPHPTHQQAEGGEGEGPGQGEVGARVEQRGRRVLVVIAHPDDEVMFFGPTILHFSQLPHTTVYLLCLSTGNYYGEGVVRSQELLASCGVLGVARDNVLLFRCDQLPDHPRVSWPTVRTANMVNQYLHALDVDMVVTFDSGGVSGHINHTSLHTALQHLVEEDLLPQGCEAYQLETVSVLRKYLSLLDVPLSYSLSSCAFTVTRFQWSLLQRAMRAHKSQLVWFRWLYLVFSRYLLINTLSRITPDP